MIIRTTEGFDVIIDDEDYDKVKDHKWYLYGNVYAKTHIDKKTVYMHRMLLNAEKNLHVDHVDHNHLNNKKENLRLCTPQQNSFNKPRVKEKDYASKYKGVKFDKRRNKWFASIMKNRKSIFLGYFQAEEEAADAYNKKAKELFGEFACPNSFNGG